MLASAVVEVDAGTGCVNIVHIETGRRFYGGAQQVIWLARGLREHGVHSVIVCPADAAISDVARQSELSVVNIPCAGEHDIRFAWRLMRFLRRERPDLVHCHSRRGADFPGGWGVRAAGIPAIVTRRVDSAESQWIANLRYRPFRRIVAISEHVAAVLRQSGVAAERIATVRSAVDTDAIKYPVERRILEQEFGITADQFAIAVVAQLIRRKGHRFLLDVLPGLIGEYPHIRVVFFGDGNEASQLRALAARLGLSATVRFAGFRADVDELLAAFDLLVHPAEKEGLGVAMLKAAAAGLPVIAFDVAGCREAVLAGRTGILVPAGDLSALQLAIAVLISEPGIRQAFGEAGRQHMQDDFAVARMVESYLQIYENVIDG